MVIHVLLSMLCCRLRQCCCHLSLLTSALHRSESEQEQEDLELELAMGALSLDGRHGGHREDNSCGDSAYVPVSLFIYSFFLPGTGAHMHNKLLIHHGSWVSKV